jgi:type IV secretory pathway protease TraF
MTTSTARPIRRWLTIGLIIAAIAMIEPHVVIPKTRSVRYHLLYEVGGPAHRGDYINTEIRHALIDRDKAATITKRVGCVSGQQLEARGPQYFCDDVFLGMALSHTVEGLPLQPFSWKGPVPAGKLFLIGDHPRSFDSRYFGFVDARQARRLWPLF